MTAASRGECPFPDSIIGILEDGALTELFRNKFNTEQAGIYESRFGAGLQTL
jgi:hypothetical protein